MQLRLRRVPTQRCLALLLSAACLATFCISAEASTTAKTTSTTTLEVCAFNVQIFGRSFMEDPEQVDVLVQVVSRYDVFFLQEIRDSSNTSVWELLDAVNADAPTTEDEYSIALSDRLGRTSSKEQYAYLYKASRVELLDAWVFNDSASDVFQREPYLAKFKPVGGDDTTVFTLIGIHTQPDETRVEIDALVDVYDAYAQSEGQTLPDVLLLGDMNAGSSYVCASCWENIRLRTDPRFVWLIGDDVDTMISSDNAHDRFIIAGEHMNRSYVPGSAQVFYFDQEFNVSSDLARLVSDHYPIQLSLSFKTGTDDDSGGSSSSDVEALLGDESAAIGVGVGAVAIAIFGTIYFCVKQRRPSDNDVSFDEMP